MADGDNGRSWWQRLRALLAGNGQDEAQNAPPDVPLVVPEVTIERGGESVPRASMRVPDTVNGVDAVALRQQMMNHLDLDGLGQVATAVDIDLQAIPGGKGRKVMGVVEVCGGNGRLPDLLRACRETRPDVAWQPGWGKPQES